MTVNMQLLGAARITRIIQDLQDVRQLPQQLTFMNRTPIVAVEDNEILARYTGYVTIADLIADDAQAMSYQAEKLRYETFTIPNIKHGKGIPQAMLNQLQMIQAIGQTVPGMDRYYNYEMTLIDQLLLGVRQRMEALRVAMAIDVLNYNRFGIILTNVSWGTPADLKVTPGTAWDTAGSATPVNDILTVNLTASVRYGQIYNRVTLSTQAFRYMIATTEFQNKARMFLAPNVSYANLSQADLNFQKTLAQNVLGMEIELYDARFWTQGADGTLTSAPFLPITKVVLSYTGDDNDPSAYDFGNAVTTESIVSGLAPSEMIGAIAGPTAGPIAYATVPGALNPPNITYWSVARGFPRKLRLTAEACLTVGTFSDVIPVGPPF